jgi:serine/threonine protein kinase
MDRATKLAQAHQIIQTWLGARVAEEAISDEEIRGLEDAYPDPELKSVLGELLRHAQRIWPAPGSLSAAPPPPDPSADPKQCQNGSVNGSVSSAPVSLPCIPGYEPCHQIDDGGSGATVWLYRNAVTGHRYAVKFIPWSSLSKARKERESIALYKERVKGHPHLVSIEHVGNAGPFLYYMMECAERARPGEDRYVPMTLDRYLRRRGRLPMDEVLAIADNLLQALEHLHAVDLFHKDVKPENILKIRDKWCLGDMGFVTDREDPKQGYGTSGYRPLDGSKDQEADLYGLGKTLYRLLTGAPLEDFQKFTQGSLRIPSDDPEAEPLRQIILGACHDDPSHRRYRNAADMRRAIGVLRDRRRPTRRIVIGTVAIAALATSGMVARWALDTPEALRIVRMDVRHYRGDNRKGLVGTVPSLTTSVGDGVRVDAGLSRLSYCYLIAYNPDGREQLCLPEDPQTPPNKVKEFVYPRGENRFVLDNGAGLQAFVLVASQRPLPPYEQWKAKSAPGPWRKEHAGGVWSFDGQVFEPLTLRSVEPFPGLPKPFKELCESWKACSDVEAIRGLAFPVQPREGNP